MKIGLLFGSFNPIHIAHLAIANYMAEFTDLGQVWLVVTPHNPLKDKKKLSDAKRRLIQVRKAIGKNSKIKACDIEFALPRPSYTINTLDILSKKYSKDKFVLIIGSDNLNLLYKWKDHKKILAGYEIYVYPRASVLKAPALRIIRNHSSVKMVDAPRMDISSTFIREQIEKGKDMSYFIA